MARTRWWALAVVVMAEFVVFLDIAVVNVALPEMTAELGLGSREIGLRCALKRLFAIPLALLPVGLGFLAILLSSTRRGWHDHLAGTMVVYDEGAKASASSTVER